MALWRQYRAGEFVVDASDRTVRRGDQTDALSPKELQLFELLADHPGEIVEKERIVATLWPDAHVSEGNLTQHIYRLRSIFGNDAIQTVPKRGYRLTLPVSGVAPVPVPNPPRAMRWRRIYTLIAFGSLVLVLLVAADRSRHPGAPDAEAYDLYLRAQSHLEEADRADAGVSRDSVRNMAMELLGKAIERKPGFADAHGLLASASCEEQTRGLRPEKFLERAEESARRALALDANNLHAWTARICLANARGRQREALAVAIRIGEMKAQSATASYAAGEALLRAGLVHPAASELGKAVQSSPRTLRFREEWAYALMLSGDALQCLEALSPVLKTQEGGFWHATNCLKQLGRWEEAIVTGEKNLATNPNSPVAYRALALAYRGAGREQKAREVLERGVRHLEGRYEAEPAGRNAIFLALLCAHLGQSEPTARWIERALRREPNNAMWLALSGVAWAALGSDDRAIEQFQMAYDAGFISRPALDWQVQPHMGSRTIRNRPEFRALLDRLDQRIAALERSVRESSAD